MSVWSGKYCPYKEPGRLYRYIIFTQVGVQIELHVVTGIVAFTVLEYRYKVSDDLDAGLSLFE